MAKLKSGSRIYGSATIDTTLSVGGAITINPSSPNPFTLPTTDGTSGQVLKTDGSGNVSWQDDLDTTLSLGSASIGELGDVDITTNAPTSGQALVWDSVNSVFVPGAVDSLPDQTGNSGKYLTTDGTNASWDTPTVNVTTSATVYQDSFTGDGSTTEFVLSAIANGDESALVSINGVVQDPSTYSITNTTLTFTTAPDSGDNIDIRVITAVSNDVSFRDFKKYIYTISSSTTSISGNDDNSLSLVYDVGFVDVYVNGVRYVEGYDYTATNGTSVTFTTALQSGDIAEVSSYGKATFVDSSSSTLIVDSADLTYTTVDQTVDTFSKTMYRTAKYLVQAVHASGVHSSEVLLTHNDTDVFITEYATVYSGSSLMAITATVDSTNVYLKVTPANTNTNINFARISIIARTIS